MDSENKLHILWTNADPETAQFMVMMYATNSMLRGWWQEVTVIIWGATARLAAENEAVQERIRIAQHAGVKFTACSACARELGVTGDLENLGVEIIPWGEPLTEIIRRDGKLITI